MNSLEEKVGMLISAASVAETNPDVKKEMTKLGEDVIKDLKAFEILKSKISISEIYKNYLVATQKSNTDFSIVIANKAENKEEFDLLKERLTNDR